MVNQDDIDALLREGGGDEGDNAPAGDEQSAPPVDAPSQDGIQQADPDAALNDAADTPDAASAGGAGLDQDDIDALMGQAAAESTHGPADAGVPGEDAALDSSGRPLDEAAAAMQAAIEGQTAVDPASTPRQETDPLVLDEFGGATAAPSAVKGVSMLNDVQLKVRIELGRTRMRVEDVLALDEGSVVELDKLAGDPVDVFVNGRLLARGEVLVLNDNFCVRITEVFSHDPHRVSA